MIKNTLQTVCRGHERLGRKPHANYRQMFLRLLFLVSALALSSHQLNAQQPRIVYLYDDLGRLMRVVNESNECATYQYDAVGNILSITRNSQCLQPPTIHTLVPESAEAGNTVCIAITGANFLGANLTTDNPGIKINRVRVSETTIDGCLDISPFSAAGSTKIIITTPGGSADRTFTVELRVIVITQDTLIDEKNTQFENATIEVSGKTLVVNGSHTFANLILRNGAVLTHSPTTATKVNRLDITVTGTLQADATSRIDVSGRGFLGGGRQGNPFVLDGMTAGFQRGSRSGSGGSYGGLGGGGTPNAVYGDFTDPNDVGSGGGSLFNVPSGHGGGLIRIVTQTLQLDGSILANGENGSATQGTSAGGSGGGIRVQVATLTGAGQIRANGGNAPNGSGGGGGRAVLYSQNVTGFDLTKVSAFGGAGSQNGAAGTVYLQGPSRENGELIVDNNNVSAVSLSTPIPSPSSGTISLTHLRVRRQAKVRVDSLLNLTGTLEISTSAEYISTNRTIAATINLTNNALVTHLPTTATGFFKVDLSSDNLIIDGTSRIDVTGRGFLGGGTSGNPFIFDGMTVGFQRGSRGGGGSYGGLGGGGTPNPVYGDFRDPNDVGSGGGSVFNVPSGHGGGLIRIVAGSMQLDGTILANGGNGSATQSTSAGGSGGGIRVDVGTLTGAGQIRANGGNAPNGGSGGGGRVAIYYRNVTGFDFSKVSALGGTGGQNGQNGSVSVQQTVAMLTPTSDERPVMKAEVQENKSAQLALLGKACCLLLAEHRIPNLKEPAKLQADIS